MSAPLIVAARSGLPLAATVVSTAKVNVVAIRWIAGLTRLRAFRQLPYKLRRGERGRFENRFGELDIAS